MTRALLVLALAAGPAAAAPTPATCRAPHSTLASERVDGETLLACWAGATRTCWRLDVAAGTWTPAPAKAIPDDDRPADPPPAFESRVRVRVCAPDRSACGTATTTPARDPELELALSPAGDTLAVVRESELALYDVAKNTRRATLAAWPMPTTGLGFSLRNTRFVGDLLVTMKSDGSTTFGRLVDPRTGVVRGALADNAPLDLAPPLALGPRVAVATRGGAALVIHDARAGALAATIVMFGPAARTELELLAASASGALVFAARRTDDDAVAVIDLAASRARTIASPPACAK